MQLSVDIRQHNKKYITWACWRRGLAWSVRWSCPPGSHRTAFTSDQLSAGKWAVIPREHLCLGASPSSQEIKQAKCSRSLQTRLAFNNLSQQTGYFEHPLFAHYPKEKIIIVKKKYGFILPSVPLIYLFPVSVSLIWVIWLKPKIQVTAVLSCPRLYWDVYFVKYFLFLWHIEVKFKGCKKSLADVWNSHVHSQLRPIINN